MPLSFYKYISYLSIDVAIGAIISSAFIGNLLNVEVPLLVYVTLGLVVWSIYSFDHLIDAKKSREGSRFPRHQFHLTHFKQLTVLLLVALSAVLVCIFYLPQKVILIGSALGLVVVLYFLSINLLHWRNIYHKELTVAFVYYSGILVGPLSSLNFRIDSSNWFYLFGYFILILLNLLIFSMYDQKADKNNDFPSLFRVVKKPYTSNLIYLLMLLFSAGLVIELSTAVSTASIILLLMFSILCFIQIYAHTTICRTYYRYLGDGIFILPVIYLL